MDEKIFNALIEEYKIIQSKIDKIGEFQLKVRSWSITLEIALLGAIFTEKISPDLYYWALLLISLIVLIFHFHEQEQKEIQSYLSERVFPLEKAIDRLIFNRDESEEKKQRLDLAAWKGLKGAPRIGVTLRNYSGNRTVNALRNMFKVKTHVFYYSQYTLIIILLLLSLFGVIPNKQNKDIQYKTPNNNNITMQTKLNLADY
jgi:hypothetical protein